MPSMTGTRISNLTLGLLLTGMAHADKLTLTGDARLTGTVRSIHESGVVELSSGTLTGAGPAQGRSRR